MSLVGKVIWIELTGGIPDRVQTSYSVFNKIFLLKSIGKLNRPHERWALQFSIYVCYSKQKPWEKKREAEVIHILSWGESFKHLLVNIVHSCNNTTSVHNDFSHEYDCRNDPVSYFKTIVIGHLGLCHTKGPSSWVCFWADMWCRWMHCRKNHFANQLMGNSQQDNQVRWHQQLSKQLAVRDHVSGYCFLIALVWSWPPCEFPCTGTPVSFYASGMSLEALLVCSLVIT